MPGTKRDFALCQWHLSRVQGIVPWPEGFEPTPEDEPYKPAEPKKPSRAAMATPRKKDPTVRPTTRKPFTPNKRPVDIELTPVSSKEFNALYGGRKQTSIWVKIAKQITDHAGQAYEIPYPELFDTDKLSWTQMLGRIRTNVGKNAANLGDYQIQISHDHGKRILIRAVEKNRTT